MLWKLSPKTSPEIAHTQRAIRDSSETEDNLSIRYVTTSQFLQAESIFINRRNLLYTRDLIEETYINPKKPGLKP